MVRLQILVIAVVLAIACLLVVTAPAQAASGEPGIRYTKMVVEPNGSDFNITVHYNASFMTRVFAMLFGTATLKSAVTDEVAGFGNVTTVSVNMTEGVARFTAANQSEYSDGWYMYDKTAHFPVPVDQLEIRGQTLERPINNATEMPQFFYQ